MLAQAEREAETYKAKLFDQARQDVAQIQQKWAESLKREKDTFFQNLRQRLVQEIFAISRRALREMADQDLEQRLFDGFAGPPPANGPGRAADHPGLYPSRRGANCW